MLTYTSLMNYYNSIIKNSGYDFPGVYQTVYPVLNNNKKNNMKEENLQKVQVKFKRTEVREFTYNVMAKDFEDAKARIADKENYLLFSESLISSITEVIS